MKRLSCILAALLVLCGCTKENKESSAPGKGLKTFTVSAVIDAGLDVRANLDEASLEVLWQKGDRIGLIDEYGKIIPAELDAEGAGTATGTFSYQAEKEISVVYAYYPYTGNEIFSEGKLSLELKQVQTYASTGFIDANTLIMAGKYMDGRLIFKNACSIVRLNLKGKENYIRHMNLSSPGMNLSGAGSMDLTEENPVFAASLVKEGDVGLGVELDVDLQNASQRLHLSTENTAVACLVLPSGTCRSLNIETTGNTDNLSTAPDTEMSLMFTTTADVIFNAGSIRPLNVELVSPEDVTVFGRVICSGEPVAGVAVTDGVDVTVTDERGYYYMNSSKPHGMVYLSIPSGYTVERGFGAVPQFYRHTVRNADEIERIDFELIDDGDQTNHTMILIGDIHLVGKTTNNNLTQFEAFVDEINDYVSENRDSKIYAMTLGDMTWDAYWEWNKFRIPDYLEYSDRFELNVYNTVGNHDNDFTVLSDWECMEQWRRYYGPTYYSLNIGQIHYISLDNVLTANGGTIDTRSYNCGLTDQIQTWLRNDLALVSKDTPVVVIMHIPLLNNSGDTMSGNSVMETAEIIDAFNDFTDVRYFSAHTHTLYNNINGKIFNWNKFAYQAVKECNVGAVCADFWGSGATNPNLLSCTDGTPGGYRILKVNGTSRQLTYKATGKDESYRFRAYDRNSIHITSDEYIPAAGENHKAEFEKYLGEYAEVSAENYIYIYVWDWCDGWNINVMEGASSLSVEKMSGAKDPLYMISAMASRCNKADSGTFTLDIHPTTSQHMFRAKASSATSDVTITVTDPFGNSDTQFMTRPRAFSVAEYSCEGSREGTAYIAPAFGMDDPMNL